MTTKHRNILKQALPVYREADELIREYQSTLVREGKEMDRVINPHVRPRVLPR